MPGIFSSYWTSNNKHGINIHQPSTANIIVSIWKWSTLCISTYRGIVIRDLARSPFVSMCVCVCVCVSHLKITRRISIAKGGVCNPRFARDLLFTILISFSKSLGLLSLSLSLFQIFSRGTLCYKHILKKKFHARSWFNIL